jgi:hypothetical protein
MVAGEVCRGFFHELKFHLEFPGFPLELSQPRPLAYGKRRFLAGMVTAIRANPVTECALVDSQLLGYSGDVSITIFTASSLNSGEKLFFARGKNFTFPDSPPYWMDCPEGSGHLRLVGWRIRVVRIPVWRGRGCYFVWSPAGQYCLVKPASTLLSTFQQRHARASVGNSRV